MAINRVEIKDFLLFKGEFATDFGTGVNVLIGGNGTGKTTLMKVMYRLCNGGKNGKTRSTEEFFFAAGWKGMELTDRPFEHLRMQKDTNDSTKRINVKSLAQSVKRHTKVITNVKLKMTAGRQETTRSSIQRHGNAHRTTYFHYSIRDL